MKANNNKLYNSEKILFFSFHFLPDQSAGTIRTKLLVEKIHQLRNDANIIILCSTPRRYGIELKKKNFLNNSLINGNKNIKIIRFWIPFLGQSPLASLVSYSFYFFQAVIYSLFVKPDITVVTSAKLLTAFLASLSIKFNKSKLFLDIRDTFVDNFFYFYRWDKRIIFISLISLIENFVVRSAYSINIVSDGFKKGFFGWDRILKNRSIEVTSFSNGIDKNLLKQNTITKVKSKKTSNFYNVIYAGNIGEGQDFFSLIKSIKKDTKSLANIIDKKIRFYFYGSGSQINKIKEFIERKENYELKKIIFLKGLIPRDEVSKVYINANCLLINLASFKSLSMVIPSKVFEYSATNLPIIYGSAGFTSDFIGKINGTIKFEQSNSRSLFKAIIKSMHKKVDFSKRESFLNKYNSEIIYTKYANHILGIK